jgi:LuxR family maltose regulon positive regulatory protein
VLEILVVRALALHGRGDVAGAGAALRRAAALGEPEGYVRVFLDEGAAMVALLRLALKERDAPDYLRHLLASAVSVERPHTAPTRGRLIEPLSERELDVLRLLQSDLDGPEIARELTVSLNTLRSHTKSIYSKLGVNSRRAAIRRAAELDLLSRSGDRPTA